jgi:uncharacterized membrane protein YkoI
MKRKMMTGTFLIASLSAGAFAVTGKHLAQPARFESVAARIYESRQQNDAAQAKLAKQAKITLEQAREIALKRAPGTIEESELEREHGRLVYSFDIRNARGTITEVQVSARSGRVVSVEEENAQQEAEEKRKEERERRKHP